MEKIDIIEIEDDEEEIHFQFTPAKSSGAVVMELQNIENRMVIITCFHTSIV